MKYHRTLYSTPHYVYPIVSYPVCKLKYIFNVYPFECTKRTVLRIFCFSFMFWLISKSLFFLLLFKLVRWTVHMYIQNEYPLPFYQFSSILVWVWFCWGIMKMTVSDVWKLKSSTSLWKCHKAESIKLNEWYLYALLGLWEDLLAYYINICV